MLNMSHQKESQQKPVEWSEKTAQQKKDFITDQVSHNLKRDGDMQAVFIRKVFNAGYEPSMILLESRKLQIPYLLAQRFEFSLFYDKVLEIQKWLKVELGSELALDDVPPYCAIFSQYSGTAPSVVSSKLRKQLRNYPQFLFYAVNTVFEQIDSEKRVKALYEF